MTFDDVWFNGTRQINAALDDGDLLDERQGEYLQAVLTHSGQRWNGAFDGEAIFVPQMASCRQPLWPAGPACMLCRRQAAN